MPEDGSPSLLPRKVSCTDNLNPRGGHHRLKQRTPADEYFFRSHKRGVDSKGPTESPAPEICEGLCRGHLDGMVAARDGDSWTKEVKLPGGRGVATVCNRHDVYLDTDDMCRWCK